MDVKSDPFDIATEPEAIPMTSQDSVEIISLRENRYQASSSKTEVPKMMNVLEFLQESTFSSVPTKPPFTMIELITMAITSTPRSQLTLKEVVNFITETFPFYKNCLELEEFVRENLKNGSFKCQCSFVSKPDNELECDMSENDLWSVDPIPAALTIQNIFENYKKRGIKRKSICLDHENAGKIPKLSGSDENKPDIDKEDQLKALCTSPKSCSPKSEMNCEDATLSLTLEEGALENLEKSKSEVEETITTSVAQSNAQSTEIPHIINMEAEEGFYNEIKDNLEETNSITKIIPVTKEVIKVHEQKDEIEDKSSESVDKRELKDDETNKHTNSEEPQDNIGIELLISNTEEQKEPTTVNKMKDIQTENENELLISNTEEQREPNTANEMKDINSENEKQNKQNKRKISLDKESDEINENKKVHESELSERPRESLFRLIATAIVTDPKGYLGQDEIHNYIAQKYPFYKKKKNMIKQCIQVSHKKKQMIQISGSRPLSKGFWTLHPLVAVKLFGNINHISRSKSDREEANTDTNKQPSCKVSVTLERSSAVDQLALEYHEKSSEKQADGCSQKLTTEETVSKVGLAPAWQGWPAPSPELLKTRYFLNQLVEKIVQNKKLSQSDRRFDEGCPKIEEIFADEEFCEQDSSSLEPFEAKKLVNHQSELRRNSVSDSIEDGLEEIPQRRNQKKGKSLGFDLHYWSGNWRGWEKVTADVKRRNHLKQLIGQLDLELALRDCERAAALAVEEMEKYERENVGKRKSVLTKKVVNKEKEAQDLSDSLQQQVKDLMRMVVNTSSMPPFSFTVLIVMAMVTSSEPSLTLSDIFLYIKEKFPFYSSRNERWQLSIQLTLRMSSRFLKVCQGCHLRKTQCHGGCWTIDFADASLILASALKAEKNKVLESSHHDTSKSPNSMKNCDLKKRNGPKTNENPDLSFSIKSEDARETLFNSPLGFDAIKTDTSWEDQNEEVSELPEDANLNLINISIESYKSAGFNDITKEKKSILEESLFLCDRLVESLSFNQKRDSGVRRPSVHVPSEKKEEAVNKVPYKLEKVCKDLTIELNSNLDKNLISEKNKLSPIKLNATRNSFTCNVCGKQFSCSFVLKHHKFSHSQVKTHPCYICHQVFSSSQILWVHLIADHPGMKNKHILSSVCQLHSISSHEHLPKSSGPSENSDIKCTKCPAVFLSKLKLSLHVKEYHNDHYKFKCNYCNPTEGFPSDEALKIHLEATHTSACDFLYVCDQCGAEFLQEEKLESHLKFVHTEEKNDYFTIPEPTDNSDGAVNEDSIVFVCKDCDTCFISEKTFSSHTCYYEEKT